MQPYRIMPLVLLLGIFAGMIQAQAARPHDDNVKITKPTETITVQRGKGQPITMYFDGREYVGTDARGEWVWYMWGEWADDELKAEHKAEHPDGGFYQLMPITGPREAKFPHPPLTLQGVRLIWDRRQKAYVSPDYPEKGKLRALEFAKLRAPADIISNVMLGENLTWVQRHPDGELPLEDPDLKQLGELKLFAERFNPAKKPWPQGVRVRARGQGWLDADKRPVKPGDWIRNGKVINMPDPPKNISVIEAAAPE